MRSIKTIFNKHKNSVHLTFLLFIFASIFLFLFKKKYINKKKNLENTIENFKVKKNKKIAFCFIIYDKINHENIWKEYFNKIDRNKYTIYIHYKQNKPLKYFENYKLNNCIKTCWGCLSIVKAQNLILEEALKDKDNQHFIWLSGHCIPLKSFDYTYNYLNINKSYFNLSPDNQVFPRAEKLKKYINKDLIKKSAMPSIINRKHASLFIENNNNIDKWFKDINIPDEIVYITLLHHFDLKNELELTHNLATDAIIFSAWNDMTNYKTFKKSKLSKNTPNIYIEICEEELNYLINSKSLFARKFEKNCKGLDNLIHKLKINNK